jgi:hypothetical protein
MVLSTPTPTNAAMPIPLRTPFRIARLFFSFALMMLAWFAAAGLALFI